MELNGPPDQCSSIFEEPSTCAECGSASRLANGICLNCLLLGAISDRSETLAADAFKEALATVSLQKDAWVIGEHHILDEIARGGMGVVYRALEPRSGRIVALKRILTNHADSDRAVIRFRREAETISHLDHPNIVPIYSIGETNDGAPYFTMKYARNGNLLNIRGIEPRQSVLLMGKVATAIQYAHDQGILHRDLKPGNILLDGRGEPLVSDFGLARSVKVCSHLTLLFSSFGTPGYVAPEQANGPLDTVTPAADIYSLGAILFELLTGRLPFLGDTPLSVLRQSIESQAPRLRKFATHLDRELETICARCLEREPQDRYESAGALAQDLLNWQTGCSITARPVDIWLRSKRWVGENGRLSTLSIAVVAIIFLALLAWHIRADKFHADVDESTVPLRSLVVLPPLDLDRVVPDATRAHWLAQNLREHFAALKPLRVTIGDLASSPQLDTPEGVRKAGIDANAQTILTSCFRKVHNETQFSFRLLDAVSGNPLIVDVSKNTSLTNDKVRAIYETLTTKDWSSRLKAVVDPGLRHDIARDAIVAARSIGLSSATDCDKAIGLFRKALAVEPKSCLGHSYLAMAAAGRLRYNADRSFLGVAHAEAAKAIELSTVSSDAHRAMAAVFYQEGKYSRALDEQLQTIEFGGLEHRIGCFIGLTLDTMGRPDQALRWYGIVARMAAALGEADALMGDCWARLNDDNQAFKAYNRATELRPNSYQGLVGISHVRLLDADFVNARNACLMTDNKQSDLGDAERIAAQIEFFAGDFARAEQLYRRLESSDPGGGGSFYGAVTYRSALARSKQALGDVGEANKILTAELVKEAEISEREPENAEAAYRVAALEACLGLVDKSIEHLQEAIQLGWIDYRSFALDPRFDGIRSHPHVEKMVEQVCEKVAELRSRVSSAGLVASAKR